jgi:putative transposase
MVVPKAYKFRIQNPSKSVIEKLDSTLNLCRELYNSALQERREAWKLNRESINYCSQAHQLKEIKEFRPDVKNVHSQILQDVLKRLDKTFKSFFQRVKRNIKAGFPRFKGKDRYDSFCFPQSGFNLSGTELTLSKIGSVKLKLTRQIVGKIKTLTIKREVNNWFAIFQVETEPQLLPKSRKTIGLDVGIEKFYTDQNDSRVENQRFFEQSQKELRRLQRAVARKKKGSRNQRKARLLVRKLHRKIRNQRLDFLHKLSTWLIKTFDVIVIEKLNIKGLVRGSLSRQISDVAWGTFFNMLRYKAEWAGKEVKEVNPRNTSQICSGCEAIVKKEMNVRVHNCPYCGLILDRDHNAAINILRLGIDLLALNSSPEGFAKESAVL